MTKRFDTVQKK